MDYLMHKEYFKSIFFDYANQFNCDNKKIHLKIEHMLNVSHIAEQIAMSIGLDEHMVNLSYVCGLFHDIGRFEQIREYGTFSDWQSTDHAELGCTIIEHEGLLDSLTNKERKMELTAIRNHNRLAIDKGITDVETLTLCKIIRDADKVDIYRVFATDDLESIVGADESTTAASTISDEIYESCVSNRCVPVNLRVTPLDKIASSLCLIYDINFSIALDMVLDQQYYRKRLDALMPEDPGTKEKLLAMIAHVERYIHHRKGNGEKQG